MRLRQTERHPGPTTARNPGKSLLGVIVLVAALSVTWFAITFPAETVLVLLAALLTASAFLGTFAT